MKHALLVAALCALIPNCLGGSATPASSGGRPVVVELFQSQGCSSCPPANANLAVIADRADVIALSFSVAYWDHLGWKDTFAQPAFAARQWDYAHGLGHLQVFTPQVVVDGRRDGVGADPAAFARLVGRGSAAASTPALALGGDAVTIGAGPAPAATADVWLVRYDPRVLQVPIRGGENGGRTLPHRNIVRQLVRIGGWRGQAERLRLPPTPDPILRTAILVQLTRGGAIVAAARD